MTETNPDRIEVTYEVTISVPDPEGNGFPAEGVPSEDEIRRAIYQNVKDIDSEDAVDVVRL